MRLSLFMLGILLGTAAITRAEAQDYPWCAIYSKDGDTHCFFSTWDQCMTTVSGIGGFCEPNTSSGSTPVVPAAHHRARLKSQKDS